MDKREASCFKGFALLTMFWHHIIGCGTFLITDVSKIHTLFSEYELNLGVGMGWGFKVCIGLFAISSGYGLYISYIKDGPYHKIFKRILKFLLTYWAIMFLVAIPYLSFANKFEPGLMLVNLFALLNNDIMLYVSFSWYVKVYLGFLVILPFIKYVSTKVSQIYVDFAFILIPILIFKYTPQCEEAYYDKKLFILSSINLICAWFPIFYSGVIIAKYGLIEKARKSFFKINDSLVETIVGLIFTFLIGAQFIYYHSINKFGIFSTLVVAFVFMFLFDYCYRVWDKLYINYILDYIGKYSFQLWLLSGMFFLNTAELQWILLLPKYSILILIWNVIILIPFAIVLSKISDYIYKFILFIWNKAGTLVKKS